MLRYHCAVDDTLPPDIEALRTEAEGIVADIVLPHADTIDREALWPEHALRAFSQAGLTGLHVPTRLGGLGQGLLGLAALTEAIGRGCASTAMCFGMHCVATAVIAAKATKYHEERYLAPIAAGQHLTTLALSEAATGSTFFLPQTRLERRGDAFVVDGGKQFVTNGSHVDSYVISTMTSEASELGEFSCLVVERDRPGIEWEQPWQGFGMRGNSSRGMRLHGVQVPVENLLGEQGEQVWYVFEVVAPYFLVAMAGTYVGVAQAALGATLQHMKSRRHAHSAQTLAQLPTVQQHVADMWTSVQKSRLLLQHAARLGDLGSVDALSAILACKADAAETAVRVTNDAMTLCGGTAYRENSTLSRLLRDARASHVMSPTTDMLKLWMGRVALGLPLL